MKQPAATLPPKMNTVFELAVQGFEIGQIAGIAGISRNTAGQYLKQIYKRFDVDSRAQLVHTAYRQHAEKVGGWVGAGMLAAVEKLSGDE